MIIEQLVCPRCGRDYRPHGAGPREVVITALGGARLEPLARCACGESLDRVVLGRI